MDKKDEALRLALDALEDMLSGDLTPYQAAKTIITIREALTSEANEQPKLSDYELDGMHHNKPHKCKYPKCPYPCPDLPDCRDAEQPAPPPECKTDAEKTAFAFGWWKALEENRKQSARMKRLPKGHKAQIMGTRMFQTMYTADQMRKFLQPSKPLEPLTDEQINLFINGRGEEGDDDYVEPTGDGFGLTDADLVRLVRRVEEAHGIKGDA